MVDSGYETPTANLVMAGTPTRLLRRNLGTVANGYPGRLVVREEGDYDVKVSDGILPPLGWIGYEQMAPEYKPASISTINVVDTEVPVISGGGFSIYMPSGLAKGTIAVQGDLLASWSEGKVVPCARFANGIGIKIPFSKSVSEYDTYVDLPAGCIVRDCIVQVTTEVASTIDVGILSSEANGDADGFLVGESVAVTGFAIHSLVDAVAANNTLGALLVESDIKSADTTALYASIPVGYICDGTAVSVSYTTGDATMAGYIYLIIDSPGVEIVGRAGAAADASSATTGIFVETMI